MVCYKCCSKFLTIYVWDLKSRESFFFFLASLKTFREQARSQSKGLLFDSMILWERNPTEKKLPKILFLSSRSCCSFAFLANITIGPGAWDQPDFFEVPTRLGNYCGFLQIKSQCLGTPVEIIDMAHH